MTTETFTEYRLMFRRPGAKRFTVDYGKVGTLEHAHRRVAMGLRGAPEGWAYRIDSREVVKTMTPWKEVKEEAGLDWRASGDAE